tara:strand:- start:160 stop:384 length:225 start_codon:yes stop_codon:yes gene_type:complete
MSQVPVKDHENWFRDSKTGSFQCANVTAYEQYMKAHHNEKAKAKEFGTLQKEVSELKSDMTEIKSLLKTLANKS